MVHGKSLNKSILSSSRLTEANYVNVDYLIFKLKPLSQTFSKDKVMQIRRGQVELVVNLCKNRFKWKRKNCQDQEHVSVQYTCH